MQVQNYMLEVLLASLIVSESMRVTVTHIDIDICSFLALACSETPF